MTEEEFERIKEAEKEKLRAQKKLAKLKKTLRRKQSIRSAVQRMAEGAQSVLSRSTDWMEQLTSETARQQARLEVALDAIEDDEPESDTDVEAYEAEREAKRAKELIRQMKQGRAKKSTDRSKRGASESDSAESSDSDATDSATGPSTSDDDLPEKTIGRMR